MALKWIDSQELALALLEKYPNKDPLTIRFTDMYEWVLALDDFDDDPKHCSEVILEAILQAWMDEID